VKRPLSLLLALACLAPQAGRVRAANGPAVVGSGAPLLSMQAGARPRGMAGAFSAVADDVNSVFSNPAGLGEMDHLEAAVTHRRLFEGVTHGHAGLVLPLTHVTARNVRDFGALSAGFSQLDHGRLPGRDAAGGALPDFGAKDHLFAVGYGKPVSSRMNVGVNVKFYRTDIAGVRTDGTAADVGLLFKPAPGRWTVGVSALNVGGDLRFVSEREKLPQAIVGGLAFRPHPERLLLAVDLVDPRDDVAGVRGGAEWLVNDAFVLRSGYDSRYDLGSGFSAGMGLRVERMEARFFPLRRFSIDYSFNSSGDLSGGADIGGVHTVSLTFRLGDK
jgi:hypothetical protein